MVREVAQAGLAQRSVIHLQLRRPGAPSAPDSNSEAARKSPAQRGRGHAEVTPGEDEEGAPDPSLTGNEIVAVNLRWARRWRNMTQADLGEKLTAITGREWSRATVSAAERSAETDRVREFDADNLLAFSLALSLPAVFFLLPPEGFEGEVHASPDPEVTRRPGLTRSDHADAILGSREPDPVYVARLRDLGRAALLGRDAEVVDAREVARDITEEIEVRIEELRAVAERLAEIKDERKEQQ